jgi:hypothetical protein
LASAASRSKIFLPDSEMNFGSAIEAKRRKEANRNILLGRRAKPLRINRNDNNSWNNGANEILLKLKVLIAQQEERRKL